MTDSNLERLIQHAQEVAANAAALSQELNDITGIGYGADGLIEATVDTSGKLIGLVLNPRVMRLDSVTLAEEVLTATSAASHDLAERLDERISNAFGDPQLIAKIKGGTFDPMEYIYSQGVRLPEMRGWA